MKCILIFDQLNDILYSKSDRSFSKHLRKLGRIQGLIPEGKDEDELSSNVIIQLFSPIVTSQRIMGCQFGNSYTSVQCQDGTNMVFDEYMGYLFVHIGLKEINWLKRMLGVCISIVKHLCGPDVGMLKSDRGRSLLLSRLLDAWTQLQDSDQAVLVEALEQLNVNAELSAATLRALQEAMERLKAQSEFSRTHALVLVENKFLSLYSSRTALDLAPSDILFLGLLVEGFHLLPVGCTSIADSTESEDGSSDEFFSPQTTPEGSPALRRRFFPLDIGMETYDGLNSQQVLLMGSGPALSPHTVHISQMEDGVFLLILVEMGSPILSSGLYEAFQALSILQNVQLQRDTEGARLAFDCLEASMKKILDGYRKTRPSQQEAESCVKRLQARWDLARKRYADYMRTPEAEGVPRVESSMAGLGEALRELLAQVSWDAGAVTRGRDAILAAAAHVRHRLADFSNFLKVKALRNFTLGSRASLTINKYLEEFPGLVHFLYIDRSNHRVTAPSLDFSSEETISLTKKKIWSMVEFSRSHLLEGHFALMWKDTTFNYAYFLWFEDSTGSPLKPKVFPTVMLQSFPIPGVLCGDFYQKLVEASFPKMSPSKVRCYELYCIHLGLATASCVLEHTRRLAATIWEVTGVPGNPLNLL